MTIDDTLDALAGADTHPALDRIEGGVFARIDAEARAAGQAKRGMMIAIVAASIAGTASASLSSGRTAEPQIALAATALAPSTLLGGLE
jgi:hypothetical protein